MNTVASVVRRWWWVLVLAVVAAAGTGYALAAGAPPTYEAQTRLLVGPFNADLNTQRAAGQLAFTYAELVRGRAVLSTTIEQLSLGIDPGDLDDAIRATPNSSTRVLTLTVISGDPQRAALIANTLAANLIDTTTSDDTRPEGRIQVIDPAVAPLVPVAPLPGLIALLSAAGGLLIAFALVSLLEFVDIGIRSQRQLAGVAGLPVMAVVRPRSRFLRSLRRDRAVLDPASEEGLHVELLSAKLEFALGPEQAARRIVLMPADQGSGGAWVTLNAATALALRGRSVQLLDVDPSMELSRLVESQRGRSGRRMLRRLRGGDDDDGLPRNLHLAQRSSAEIEQLSDSRARQIFDEALQEHDVVVVHAPPVQMAPNAVVWARVADAVVLVVRSGDPAPLISELLATLRLLGARPVGTVLVQGPVYRPPPAAAGAGTEREPDRSPALRRDAS